MALFNDIYCQICDRFNTKKQWNKHFSLVCIYIKNKWLLASLFATKKINKTN